MGAGGQNVLNSTLNMAYENLLQQVNLAEQLTSSDFGVSTILRINYNLVILTDHLPIIATLRSM